MSPTDIGVGAGTLPEEVVDSASRSSLQKAQGNDQWAKVVITTTGTIDVNVGVTNVSTTLDVQRQAPDAVDGSVEGPCAGPAYHGVFDNSTGVHSVEFRFRWETAQGTRLVTQSVPAGQVYKTWPHWAKPGSIVRVSYRNRTTGRWINLSARMAVRGYFAPCSYTPGFE